MYFYMYINTFLLRCVLKTKIDMILVDGNMILHGDFPIGVRPSSTCGCVSSFKHEYLIDQQEFEITI